MANYEVPQKQSGAQTSMKSPFYMSDQTQQSYNAKHYDGYLQTNNLKLFHSANESLNRLPSYRGKSSGYHGAQNDPLSTSTNPILQKISIRISEEYRKKQIQQQQQTPFSLISHQPDRKASKSRKSTPLTNEFNSSIFRKPHTTEQQLFMPSTNFSLNETMSYNQAKQMTLKRLSSLQGRHKSPRQSIKSDQAISFPTTQNVSIESSQYNPKKEICTASQQPQQLFPLTKIFLLNRINGIQDMKKEFLNFDLQPFLLAHFKKNLQKAIDVETISRLQPHIKRVITDPTVQINREKPLNPHIVFPQTKPELIKLINDFEANTTTEKRFFEIINHICVPSQKYREQILNDMIETINQKGENTKKYFDRIEHLFDVNGNIINEVLTIPYPTLLILAGDSQTTQLKNSLLREFEEFIQQERRQLNRPSEKSEESFIFSNHSILKKDQSIFKAPNTNPKKLQNIHSSSVNESPRNRKGNNNNNNTSFNKSNSNSNPFDSGFKENSMMQSIQYEITNPGIAAYAVQGSKSRGKRNHSKSLHQSTSMSSANELSINQLSGYDVSQIRTKQLVQTHKKPNQNMLTKLQIDELCRTYPTNMKRDDVFRYHSEFQSLRLMNSSFEERCLIEKDPNENFIFAVNFFVFCTPFKLQKHNQILQSILKALHLDLSHMKLEEVKLTWEKFVLLRALFEQKAEDDNVLELFWRLLDPMRIGTVSRKDFFNLLDSSLTLVSETGVEAKLYPHQIWNYFSRHEFVDENDTLIIRDVINNFSEHKFTILYLIHWILNNFDESSELEIDSNPPFNL